MPKQPRTFEAGRILNGKRPGNIMIDHAYAVTEEVDGKLKPYAYSSVEEQMVRAAACLEACKGIPTEELEGGIVADLARQLGNLVGLIENLSRHIGLADVDLTLMPARHTLQRARGKDEEVPHAQGA